MSENAQKRIFLMRENYVTSILKMWIRKKFYLYNFRATFVVLQCMRPQKYNSYESFYFTLKFRLDKSSEYQDKEASIVVCVIFSFQK